MAHGEGTATAAELGPAVVGGVYTHARVAASFWTGLLRALAGTH
jgi:hypothetical protein